MLVLPHLLDCGVCRVEGHVSVLLYKQSTHRSMLDKDCDDASAYVLLKESLNRCADEGVTLRSKSQFLHNLEELR